MPKVTADQLSALKAEFPYHWKVQTAKSWGCECVAYVDARQVMDLLDEVVGPANWQDQYREVAGKVYCELSICVDGEWLSKSDCGTASNFEAEKGQASDAFKRAAVKWGVGRFLYALPVVKLGTIEVGKDNQGRPRYAPADEKKRRIYPENLDAYISRIVAGGRKHEPLMATVDQKENIKDLARDLGWNSEKLKSYLSEMKTTWKALNQVDASKVLNHLERATKARPKPTPAELAAISAQNADAALAAGGQA